VLDGLLHQWRPSRLDSTALISIVCSDGFFSSRYSATWSSVTRRRSGVIRK
jgi:hypothetical protein